MAKNLEKYDKLVIAVLIIAFLMIGTGYWFAHEKSEPVYLSKIDRLMFDKNNKSPAFLITLPDDLKSIIKTDEEPEMEFAKPQILPKPAEPQDIAFSLEDLINNIPNLSKLPDKTFPVTLRNITALPELTEVTEEGLSLPKISDDGHRPWIEYGQTSQIQPNFKKIAIVIGNLGFDGSTTDKVASAFAPEVSLSFHPYITRNAEDIMAARTKGHETYRDILLASADYLTKDTGPLAINLDLADEEILNRFHLSISQPHPIGGIIIREGYIAENNIAKLTTVLEEVRNRGLLMIDATSSEIISSIKISGLPRRKADIVLDNNMTQSEIDAQIKKAENIAFDKGQVLIVTENKPLAIITLSRWIDSFSPQLSYEEAKTANITKPFALVPVSNLVVE